MTANIIILLMAACVLSGCVINMPPQPDDPNYAPVLETRDQAPPSANGSLYRMGQNLDLFSDRKANRIGDIITVVLNENTSSSKTANVEVIKESDVSVGNAEDSSVFDIQPRVGNFGLNTNVAGEREFIGEAGADQSNRLSGRITVTVVEVYPNGTLFVRGEKWLTLNRGDEYIRISGLIRPEDISSDNTVTSTKLANARIAYSGTGEFAESQQMGWLTRFFNNPIWPF